MELNASRTILYAINWMRTAKEFTDIIILVRGKEFSAHRNVLVAGSDYFLNMLRSKFKESNSNMVTIDDDPDLFERVLMSIYCQSPFSTDFKINMNLVQRLKFYQVKTVDLERYLLKIEVPPSDFEIYVTTIEHLYPEEVPGHIIDRIASLITSETDLSFLSDETITALLTSPSYNPKNIQEIYNLISDLLKKGHSTELATLINYDLFPADLIGDAMEYLKSFNKGGPLPRLGKVPIQESGKGIKVYNNYDIDVKDATGIIRSAMPYIEETLQIGDIITTDTRWSGSNVLILEPTR